MGRLEEVTAERDDYYERLKATDQAWARQAIELGKLRTQLRWSEQNCSIAVRAFQIEQELRVRAERELREHLDSD